jgi:hypothetical protein
MTQKREQFVNNATTELSALLTSVATTASVLDGSVFPADGDFRILIGGEIMLCTARSTNTLTIVRAQEATTAAVHGSGDICSAILTASALETYQKENTWSGNASFPLRVYKLSDVSQALVADFTWLNQGGATAADSDGRIVLTAPADVATNIRGLYQSAPTAPYEIVMAFNMTGQREVAWQHGLFFRENSSGEIMAITRHHDDTLEVLKHNSATALNSSVSSDAWQFGSGVTWLKIEDDNTDLKFYTSPNGQDWYLYASEGRTAFMAAGPDQVGFYSNPEFAASNDAILEVLAFGEV